MNFDDLQRLLDDVKRGALETRHASERILQALRAAPFEDLGFARIDTHRDLASSSTDSATARANLMQAVEDALSDIRDDARCLLVETGSGC